MEEYLWGVVAAEMPASFEEEALKAQACAARTYTVTLQEASSPRHPDAQICDDSGCCQAYLDRAEAEARWGANAELYSGKIQRAVEETDGLGVLYNGAPIQAVFFSSAAGRTVGAVEAWGNSVDYLVGVESPEGEEVPNYHSQVVLTAEEVRTAALAQYPGRTCPGIPQGGSRSRWKIQPAEWPPWIWEASPSPGARCGLCSGSAPPAFPCPGTGKPSPLTSPATDTGWA